MSTRTRGRGGLRRSGLRPVGPWPVAEPGITYRGANQKIQLVKTKHNRRPPSLIYRLDVGARIFYI